MVLDIAAGGNRLRRAQSAVLALILLLAGARAGAAENTLRDLFRNTTNVVVTRDGAVVQRGVGLFLGMHDGKALLLTPAHVVPDAEEVGKPGSRYRFEVEVAGSLEPYGYGESRLQLKRSTLAEAILADYLIVELPVGHAKQAAISNLTKEQLRRPDRNQGAIIYSPKPRGYSFNSGALEGIGGGDVISFDIKTDKIIEKGESGSPILGSGEGQAIHGILTDSDGKIGRGVFPAKELDSALQTIGRAKGNSEDLHGISLVVVPTYQYQTITQDLGGGNTHNETNHAGYTSFELEYFSLKRQAGESSANKLGLVAGYSGGKGHGLGQVENADYTVKYGVFGGSVDRVKDNTGQVALFALSHRVNGKYVTRIAASMEATTQLSVRSYTAFDVGLRLEIDKISKSNSSGSLGLVLRYSWFRAL